MSVCLCICAYMILFPLFCFPISLISSVLIFFIHLCSIKLLWYFSSDHSFISTCGYLKINKQIKIKRNIHACHISFALYIIIIIISSSRWCPWGNGYRRRKWTRRDEFKAWTRLIVFHIALIPLGKVWIRLFSLQLWVNSKTDWVLQPWWGN